MKIDSNFKPSTVANTPAAVPRAAPPKATPAAEVHLSEAAARLASRDDSAAVDSARIEEIKSAMSEGRFKIDAGVIADSLIATARELIDSRRKA